MYFKYIFHNTIMNGINTYKVFPCRTLKYAKSVIYVLKPSELDLSYFS
jgi:hypothetical protein